MLLPLLLITLAVLSAAAMAYGTHPGLANWSHGLEIIMLTRRLQWPLVALSLILCVVLLVLVISGRRRAWWLIGLAPVVALFFHHFAQAQPNKMAVIENPSFVDASSANFMRDDDWIVGVVFDGQPYAYSYRALWSAPVVLQTDHEHRLMLMWSPLANCAKVFEVDRALKARDLEVVAMPASALLVYNTRVGQFINGLRGELARKAGGKPSGFDAPLPSVKTTWGQWKAAHPDARVMVPERIAPDAPSAPVAEEIATTQPSDQSNTRVAFIPTTQPLAIPDTDLSAGPINADAGTLPVLVYRDNATGAVRAFDRRVESDLIPRFELNHDAKRKDVKFIDRDTNSGWSAGGVAVDGAPEMKGKRLHAIDVEDDVYWSVMKHWYPNAHLFQNPNPPQIFGENIPTTVTPSEPTERNSTTTLPHHSRKKSKRAH